LRLTETSARKKDVLAIREKGKIHGLDMTGDKKKKKDGEEYQHTLSISKEPMDGKNREAGTNATVRIFGTDPAGNSCGVEVETRRDSTGLNKPSFWKKGAEATRS